MPLFLGIDTGGTYTDAVVFSQDEGVLAKAKSLTTRHDLSEGVEAAALGALAKMSAGVSGKDISLVSLSTTLATNALVEGQGGRVCLIMIGFGEADLDKAGLRDALGSDPVIFLPGGHDVHGGEIPLETQELENQLDELAKSVSAFAVAGYFAVRNPAHELAVAKLLATRTGLPVTSSHELSAKLNGPKRALTTLLNARLISMIARLIDATQDFLTAQSIDAPLMVVRGDGALVSAEFARKRPIETILSGPAASLVGAQYLTGEENALVSDIGGTTTDIAILQDGFPAIAGEGARVGGWQTMVEAVAMRTHGLGGDSEVRVNSEGLSTRLMLGPRRVLPTSLLVQKFPQLIPILEKQARADFPARHDGAFAVSSGLSAHLAAGLEPREAGMYEKIGAEPIALTQLLTSVRDGGLLQRLVVRGLVQVSGFTPSDAAHVLGLQENWSHEGAVLSARIFARQRNGSGNRIAQDEIEMAKLAISALERRSAEVILDCALEEDGYPDNVRSDNFVMQRLLSGQSGIANIALNLDRPVIGLGASAKLYYPAIGKMLGVAAIVPDDSDVANAIGAVVGQVRTKVVATITQPREGLFHIVCGDHTLSTSTEDVALEEAQALALKTAKAQANEAGAVDCTFDETREIQASEEAGKRTFVEGQIIVTASGRPRLRI